MLDCDIIERYVLALFLQTQVREIHLQHSHLRWVRCTCWTLGYSLFYAAVWLLYDSLYNCVYTDFIPPAKGVQRRFKEEL